MRRHTVSRVVATGRLITLMACGFCLAACLHPAARLHAGPDQIGPRLDNYGEAVLPLHGTIVLQGDEAAYGAAEHSRRAALNGANTPRSAITITDVLQHALPGVSVLNHGFPGDTAAQSANRWADAPVGDLLILCLGIGDYEARTPQEAYGQALRALVQRGKARGAAVFILLSPPSAESKLYELNAYRSTARMIGADMGVDVFDPSNALYQAQLKPSKGLYATPDIYRAMARAIIPYVQVVKPKA